MGMFGVRELNLEGHMIVDIAEIMEMAVMDN